MKKMTKKKKLFRKVTALAAVIALGASLAGCGSSDGETTQRYSWPLATASPEDTVTQIFAEKFAEEISELSDGRMKIQVYANSTLGGDRDLLDVAAENLNSHDQRHGDQTDHKKKFFQVFIQPVKYSLHKRHTSVKFITEQ